MNFEFFTIGRIIVQRGGIRRLGELAATAGKNALLVHNAAELAARAESLLREATLEICVFRQDGEPTVSSVRAAVDQARRCGCGCVIGLGGGSAIDCAKAAAAILANGGDPLDYMEVVGRGQKITKPSVPWIAVPTTAGTGAEATRNAVVGYPEKQFKASIRSELMLPKIALLDAELALSVPKNVTAASGADALCQVIESYTSSNANAITDALAFEGIRLAATALRRAYDDPGDLDAREDMAIVALLSGITLTNAGLGAVHGFAAPMGGMFKVPHGVICAALLPHVIRANVKALRLRRPESPSLGKYAAIGRALLADRSPSDEQAVDSAVNFLSDLTAYMQIPQLREFGITQQSIGQIVPMAKKASSMRYNPVPLDDTELAAILSAAI